MPSELLSAFILLSLVVDPIGNVPLVNAMLADVAAPRRRWVILRECLIAFATLAAFMFFATGALKLVVPRVKLMEKMHWAKTWTDTNVKLLGLAEVLGAVGLIVPAFSAFDIKAEVVSGRPPVSWAFVAMTLTYAACYAGALVGASMAIFSRREFK